MSFIGNVTIPNANALIAAGDVYLNNLHISGTTTISGDLNISGTSTIGDIYAKNISVENLTVSGASNLDIVNAIYTTVLSSINISGTATLTAIDAISASFNDFLTVTGHTILNNQTTIGSTLNVSGNSTLQGETTISSSLNVSGNSTLQSEVTLLSSLNVSGNSSITGSISVTGLTTLNNQTTMVSSLNVSGKTTLQGMSTLLSSLNVSGLTLLGNQTTVNSSLNISGKTTLQGATSLLSTLNISGQSTLQGATTLLSSLNISGNSTLQGISTLLSSLNVSGNSTLQGSTTLLSTLNVSGQTSLQGDTSLLASVFVSGQSLLQGDSYLLAGINVSGTSTLKGAVSINSTLNVSGNTTIQGIITLLSSLNVSGLTQIQGATSLLSTLNVSGNTTLQGAASVLSNLSVSGITHLQNNTVLESTLYVSGKSLLQGETTLLSNLNVSGQSMLQGNVDILGTLNVSGKSTLSNQVTLSSSLNVSGQTELQGDVNLLSSLTVSGSTTLLNYVTLNSGLNVSGQTTLMGDVYIDSEFVVKDPTTLLSTLNIGSNTTIDGATTINSTLSVNDILRVNTINSYSDLYTNQTDPNQIINIVGHVINIGGPNSHINIAGTSTSIVTTEINIEDPLFIVNTVPGPDNLYGNAAGLQINGISGVGYLMTDMNATGFLIKAPMSDLVEYIATKDGSENIFVTGASLIYGNITGLSDINISGKAYLHGPVTLDSQLYVSGSSLFQGGVSMDSTLSVSGLTLLQGATNLLSSLNVSGQTILQGASTLLSSINISGKSVLNGDVTLNSNLNVNGSTSVNGATTINSTLNVSNNLTVTGQLNVDSGINMSGPTNVQSLTATGTLTVSGVSVLQGYVTIISGLSVNANTILQGSTTNSSSLNVSGQTTLQGSTTLLSSLNISGQTNLQGATTLLSSLNVSGLTVLSNNTTVGSSLNVSGKSTLLGAATMTSSLNVSGQTTLGNQTTLVSTLNVSGKSTLQGEVTLMSSLNVSGNSTLQGSTTLVSSLNVSGNTLLQGFTSLLSSLNVSGLTSLQGNTTINSSLNVLGNTTLNNQTTLLSSLNVSGTTQLNGSTSLLSSLNVSGLSTMNNMIVNNNATLNNISVSGNASMNNMTLTSTLNVSGLSTLNNLNVSGQSNLNNLNVSGTSNINNIIANGSVSLLSNLNVSGLTMLNSVGINNLNVTGLNVMNSLMNVNTVILGSAVSTLETSSNITNGVGVTNITIPTAGTYKANITNFASSGTLNFNPTLNLVSGNSYSYSFTLQTSSGMSGNLTLIFTDGTNTLATINPTSTLTTYTGSFTSTTNNVIYLYMTFTVAATSAYIQWTDFSLNGIQNTGTTVTTMYVNKLGVGMTNPSSLFQVSGTSTLGGATTVLSSLNVSGLTNINNSLIVYGSSTVGSTMNVVGDINFGGKLYMNGSEFTGNPTTLSYLNITNGITIGSNITLPTIDNATTNTTILNFKNIHGYGIYADSTSVISRGNTLDFKSYDYNSGTISTRSLLTLRPEGNVGIGTTSPAALFHAYGDSIIGNLGGTNLIINDIATAKWKLNTGGYGLTFSKHTGSSATDYTSWSPKVIFDQNGYVGIGTTTPTVPLQVNGSIYMTATDFRMNAGGDRGNSGSGRALVHDINNSLTINYGGDFTGGVNVRSSLSSTGIMYAPGYGGGDQRGVTNYFKPNSQIPGTFTIGFYGGSPGGYGDGIQFNTYYDSSGGNQNLVLFQKSGIGMRIYQGGFQSSSDYSTYMDAVLANSSGNVGLGMSPSYRLDVSGYVRSSGGENIANGYGGGFGQYRAIAGSYGWMIRNDGSNTYFLLTAANDQYGVWNGLRPMRIDNSNGNVFICSDSSSNMIVGSTEVPGAVLDVRGRGNAVDAVTFQVLGNTLFDGSNIVNFQCQASQYGRNHLYMTGRDEAGNDAWSASSGRNNIIFRHQSSLNSTYTKRWAIQSFGGSLGFLSPQYSETMPVLHLTNGGYVGIKTTSPQFPLHVEGTARCDNLWLNHTGVYGGGGWSIGVQIRAEDNGWTGDDLNFYLNWASNGFGLNFKFANDGNAYNSRNSWGGLSDISLKENIEPSPNYLDKLRKFNVVKYSLKEDKLDAPNQLGLIAQEVELISPGLVQLHKRENIKSVKYSVISMMMLKGIQEICDKDDASQQMITELQTKNASLEAENTALKSRVDTLETQMASILAWARTQGFSG